MYLVKQIKDTIIDILLRVQGVTQLVNTKNTIYFRLYGQRINLRDLRVKFDFLKTFVPYYIRENEQKKNLKRTLVQSLLVFKHPEAGRSKALEK